MKALALDFDGVISDSARECFRVALTTWGRLHPDSSLAGAEPGDATLYRGFLALLPLGNRAEDFGVALSALDARARIPDQAAYDAFRARWSAQELARFHERFYAERRAWQDRDPAGWRRLVAPYAELLDVLRRHAGEVELAIATAKDARSVGVLLEDYGVADLFPADRILDKETGVSKRAHLEALRERLGVAPEEITFLDDKVNHLEAVAGLGVRCALAAWGYNGEREWRRARERGFAVCRLDDVEATLFADAAPGARGGAPGCGR